MSMWTHVAAIVRIDGYYNDPDKTFDELFGKECLWDDDDFEDVDVNPDKYLPTGSEGSLYKTVWINPNPNHFNAYTVSIFGDLRDFSDPKDVVNWFKNVVEAKCTLIRQATITANNGYEYVNWTYGDDNDETDDLQEQIQK